MTRATEHPGRPSLRIDRHALLEHRALELVAWSLLAVIVTAVLVALRENISDAHVALGYLLIVLGASARLGRRAGLAGALIAFLAFNYFFIKPLHTLNVHHPSDLLVLFAFLAASSVATQLLHRAQSEAERTRQRALEIDRLAAVGAEALNAPRAVDAVSAVARVVRAGLNVAICEIYLVNPDGELVLATQAQDVIHVDQPAALTATTASTASTASIATTATALAGELALERAAAGLAIGEAEDGSSYVAGTQATLSSGELAFGADTRALLLPLRVRDEVIGILRIYDPKGIHLDVPQQRFAEALSYYAVLALERVRFAADAEHAEALREADLLKNALLASVSHDLRTPLTTIKALAHDIAVDGDERAVIIEEESDRLNRFVSDLLDLSRLNAGAESMTPELIAAEDVLGAALQRVSGAGQGRSVNARLDHAEPLLVGRFDFVHTLRALVNLIENALKYSPADACVDVSARRDASWIAFDVADRGPGVRTEDRARMFEPFVRGADSGTHVGVGLGLAIARQSVELQGGSLRYSPRDGGGSLFTLRVPLASDDDLGKMSL